MKSISLPLRLIAFVALLTPALQATTVILNSTAQVGIRDSAPTTKQNGTGTVIVGNTGSGSGETLHGLVRFNTSSIVVPGGQAIDINSVTLTTLNDTAGGGTSLTIQVYGYGYEFVEADATWNNPAGNGSDTTAGGTTGLLLSSSLVTTGAGDANTFNSTANFISIVEAAINGDDTVNLLLMRNTFSDANIFTRFDESAAAFKLTVDYDFVLIPEPSAALLGGIGALLLLRRRR